MEKKRQKRDALIEEYREYVELVAKKLIHSMGLPSCQYDEFVAAGYLGLVEAASRFRARDGVPFQTFAYLRIRGAIIDSIRECSDVSGPGYQYARALQAAQSMREEELEAPPAKPIAKRRGPKANRLSTILDYAAKSALAFRLSMQDAEHEMSAQSAQLNPEEAATAKRQSQLFMNLIADLPEKERVVIEEYYFNERSFSEIAESHALLSKSWVSRLHGRALAHLKDKYAAAIDAPR